MPEIIAYYVDDQASSDALRYQERLSREEEIRCLLYPPPMWGNLDTLLVRPPDLFLIDYELSRVQPDGTVAPYQGSTLAAEIRTRLPNCPIVLITRESILNQLNRSTRRQLTENLKVYDEIIYKCAIDDELEAMRQLLISIAKGFAALDKIPKKTWNSLIEVLGAGDEEADLLREAIPPLEGGEWIVSGAANWIRNTVLKYPGVLYNPMNAATSIGISAESFRHGKVQELFTPAKYNGIFETYDGSWWKDRLFKISKQLAMEEGFNGPLNQTFGVAFQKKYGVELLPSVCIWDNTPIADWVCYILKQPVKLKNSLRYYPDSRPAVMDPARISFRAIRESEYFDEELLDTEGIELIREIETLPEP